MMTEQNNFEFEVWGNYALFTEPLVRGGEKSSTSVPTYQSLIGITESLYWKPTLRYVIQKVRVMNPIRVEAKAMRPLDKNFDLSKNTLSYYNYLRDVRYQVQVRMEWNLQRDDLKDDRNLKKHAAIFNRALQHGGRRDVFLGTRECQAYVKPIKFGEGVGVYDEVPELYIGNMVHGINYPNETGNDELSVRFWSPTMKYGVIDFPKPENVKTVQFIRKVSDLGGHDDNQFQPVDALYNELFGGDGR